MIDNDEIFEWHQKSWWCAEYKTASSPNLRLERPLSHYWSPLTHYCGNSGAPSSTTGLWASEPTASDLHDEKSAPIWKSPQLGKAVLYYTSWWDFVGIKIKIVGMDPNCCHPNPRPTTRMKKWKLTKTTDGRTFIGREKDQLVPGLLLNIVTIVIVPKVSKVPNMFQF